jgi:hypothetical protein
MFQICKRTNQKKWQIYMSVFGTWNLISWCHVWKECRKLSCFSKNTKMLICHGLKVSLISWFMLLIMELANIKRVELGKH